jgi:hypothetical protein
MSVDVLNKTGYCLTGDNLLKMLAIFIRLRVGIPVILMGECGYGPSVCSAFFLSNQRGLTFN